ncbi:MAG: DUF1572 family protein [candidate division Zixibacteria bacterium]
MPLTNYLNDIQQLFSNYKKLAEKAMAQIGDDVFFRLPDERSNSIAITVKHMAGNMRSRWTDFLTSDGEKQDRNRDYEFVLVDGDTRENLMIAWEGGWKTLFDALNPLNPDDLSRTILIRSKPHTVIEAINRQLTHYAYHVGQIVYLARHWSEGWESLSIPKGESDEFNRKKRGKSDSSNSNTV